MELLAKFDAKNYSDTTAVLEKYTVRGIILRDGKLAMQCSRNGEYKIPGGGPEPGESYLEALVREIHEETGFWIKPETVRELGEIMEVRRDIFDETRKYICHSFFYYCEVGEEQDALMLTPSEVEKGYELKWETPEEVYRRNIQVEKDPWIIRDTAFVKMLVDGKIL